MGLQFGTISHNKRIWYGENKYYPTSWSQGLSWGGNCLSLWENIFMGHLRAREDRKEKTVELNLYVKLLQKSEDKD